ncbi:hypothetical protein [Klebsiella michiganensis]|uniref:hypothetical protein n=1 Tax=Klebsiella michiganensis TaxID=1134687 RepID=UPI00190BCA5A|nr:hypothetical protein [Klebsiella michiganensis]QQO66692.1 hypothetical protein IE970_27285 [Klebsiella michiganensis]
MSDVEFTGNELLEELEAKLEQLEQLEQLEREEVPKAALFVAANRNRSFVNMLTENAP